MELNLVEILENVPIGTKLYSPLLGEVTFEGITSNNIFPIKVYGGKQSINFTKYGQYFDVENGECVLFPSKENRDWSTFKIGESIKVGDHVKKKGDSTLWVVTDINSLGCATILNALNNTKVKYTQFLACSDLIKVKKFDSALLKPFDPVLVRDNTVDIAWHIDWFSHTNAVSDYPYVCLKANWQQCIPHNNETEHLLNTTDEAPEFYRTVYI